MYYRIEPDETIDGKMIKFRHWLDTSYPPIRGNPKQRHYDIIYDLLSRYNPITAEDLKSFLTRHSTREQAVIRQAWIDYWEHRGDLGERLPLMPD